MLEKLGPSPEEMGLEANEASEKEKPVDALVVFGFGITSDQDSEKAAMGKKIIGQSEKGWRLPLGAKLRTMAAARLFKDGQIGDVIFTGGAGKVEEGIEASEAELMRDYFKHKLENWWTRELKQEGKSEGEIKGEVESRMQNAESHVLLEDKATNTIENITHTINFLQANKEQYRNIGLLSNDFHINRIVKLADKLGVSGTGIGAEPEVSQIDPRYQKIAENYFGPEQNKKYRQEVLEGLDDEQQKVVEARLGVSREEYDKGERRWSRGLDQIPEYWLPNVKFIKDPDQLKNVLKAEQSVQDVLKEHGIESVDDASEDEIRNALEGIERKMPPPEWGEEEGK